MSSGQELLAERITEKICSPELLAERITDKIHLPELLTERITEIIHLPEIDCTEQLAERIHLPEIDCKQELCTKTEPTDPAEKMTRQMGDGHKSDIWTDGHQRDAADILDKRDGQMWTQVDRSTRKRDSTKTNLNSLDLT